MKFFLENRLKVFFCSLRRVNVFLSFIGVNRMVDIILENKGGKELVYKVWILFWFL